MVKFSFFHSVPSCIVTKGSQVETTGAVSLQGNVSMQFRNLPTRPRHLIYQNHLMHFWSAWCPWLQVRKPTNKNICSYWLWTHQFEWSLTCIWLCLCWLDRFNQISCATDTKSSYFVIFLYRGSGLDKVYGHWGGTSLKHPVVTLSVETEVPQCAGKPDKLFSDHFTLYLV